ncbi:integral membrane protein [Gulosibacter sp. 10]|nr:integral membrane protein [Gulosibacter sp. 10]
MAKSALAVVLSWLLCVLLLGEDMPVFAAIATLLVVAPSINQSFTKGLERSLGVVVGVIIAALSSLAFGAASWVVMIAILVAMLLAWALRASTGMANQMAISAMLVIALGAGSFDYSLLRILETVLGAVVGIVINALIVPPVLVEPARRDLELLGNEIAASMKRLADALETPQSTGQLDALVIEARLMKPMREQAEKSIEEGFESLRLNPRGSKRRAELAEMQRLLTGKLGPMVTQVIGMTRAFFDHYEASLPEEPAAWDIAEQLRRAAHDLRMAVYEAEVVEEPLTSAIPALTAPLVLRPPTRGNWVLIGSLMEDLRRIRLALVDDEAVED